MAAETNTYLEQVVAQQSQLESDLRRSKRADLVAARLRSDVDGAPPSGGTNEPDRSSPAVEVRVTGFGRWKTVLVPPNAYVVHTRRGRAEPLHVGLGVSFKYNPATDSYLVVPGAMQTILINAYCICRELQGVLVQAYVQWIIQDFATAYRKLDFSDPVEPMSLVNLQLKEQAEATIKDKVATLSVLEVLSDKQPVIEELTARLRGVAEGEGNTDTGLGLRIVTVQIKEAVVSSSRLWQNLQKPFRSDQERLARLAELAAQEAIAEREMTAGRERETLRLRTEQNLTELRDENAARTFDRQTAEKVRRAERDEQDSRTLAELQNATTLHALRMERERQAEEAEIARQRVEREYALKQLTQDGELALVRGRAEVGHEGALLELERDRLRAEIGNNQSAASIQGKLIDALPEVVAQLPKPTELRTVAIGGNDPTSVAGLIAELGAVVSAIQAGLARPPHRDRP